MTATEIEAQDCMPREEDIKRIIEGDRDLLDRSRATREKHEAFTRKSESELREAREVLEQAGLIGDRGLIPRLTQLRRRLLPTNDPRRHQR